MNRTKVKRPSRARQAFKSTKEARRIRMNEAENRVMWKMFPGAKASAKRKVSPQRVELRRHAPRVHRFETSEDAYDASQTDDNIHDGDILLTEEGPVAIMMRAWPMAVTRERGSFHTLQKGVSWSDFEDGEYQRSYRIAKRLARTLGRRDASRSRLTRRQTSVLRRKMKTLSREKRPQKQKVAIAFRYARKSKRDVTRADLKHLSVGALLKLLRQAVKKGDDDLAEAIGKELDRRGGGFRRDAEDDYQFEGRVMQAARLARIVWKPSQMSAQQWPPRYAHVREAGGEFFVVAPRGDVVGVFASLPVAVRKARGVDRLHLKKYGRR